MSEARGSRWKRVCFFVAAFSSALSGCGGPETPELADVTGVVTLDGRPAPDLLVSFNPEKGRASDGVTDKDGKYRQQYLFDTPGATLGKHVVKITTYIVEDDSPEALKARERVPQRYNRKSELTAEVKPGPNVINFELKSK
ncbi:hypothetical protein [Caulifigura coniformis]|nr:hypothetical protein [Caulifigura coniformis]